MVIHEATFGCQLSCALGYNTAPESAFRLHLCLVTFVCGGHLVVCELGALFVVLGHEVLEKLVVGVCLLTHALDVADLGRVRPVSGGLGGLVVRDFLPELSLAHVVGVVRLGCVSASLPVEGGGGSVERVLGGGEAVFLVLGVAGRVLGLEVVLRRLIHI